PLTAGSLALLFAAYLLLAFFHYLEQRARRPVWPTAVTAPDAAFVAEERRRQREAQTLEAALAALRANPADEAARRDLDAWIDSDAARRADLPPEVNLGLGRYLLT